MIAYEFFAEFLVYRCGCQLGAGKGRPKTATNNVYGMFWWYNGTSML